uniref:Bestrophin homolog n=1 Tax=Schistosoma japonicum TaxID=6182 RepID=C1L441_SCHJA|nr:Bestrophin-3 (Vitelliform macular dystrophy 2-like protein 3) [Schistosoma japonicum]
MTVTYSSIVATAKYWTFIRLLFMWKGSVYRLVWFEFLVFVGIYSVLSVTYRFILSATLKRYFEQLCIYCGRYNETVPVAFVLGFYVSLIVQRWWEQFLSLPWPDRLALFITAFCHGNAERPTRIRRNIVRYINLSYCIALRAISSRARLRFPTEEHLVSAGLMTQEELDIYRSTQPSQYTLYFVPLVWALDMVTKAREEGYIHFDRAVEILTDEITSFRSKLGTIFAYDWVNPPLVYTQTVTIAVYGYFGTCLLAWQYLDPSKKYEGHEIDIYVPIFGLLRFFFYIGWLKVAESLINPFGEDVDDFEIEYLIERNLQVSYLIVDGMHHEHPDLVRDAFWNTTDIVLPDWTKMATDGGSVEANVDASDTADKFIGSLANFDVTERRPSVLFWNSSNLHRRRTSSASAKKSPQIQ